MIITNAQSILFVSFYDDSNFPGDHDFVLLDSSGTIRSTRKSINILRGYEPDGFNFVLNASTLRADFEILSEPFFIDLNNTSTSTTWKINKLRIFSKTSTTVLADVTTFEPFDVGPKKRVRFYAEGLMLKSQDEIDQPD